MRVRVQRACWMLAGEGRQSEGVTQDPMWEMHEIARADRSVRSSARSLKTDSASRTWASPLFSELQFPSQ